MRSIEKKMLFTSFNLLSQCIVLSWNSLCLHKHTRKHTNASKIMNGKQKSEITVRKKTIFAIEFYVWIIFRWWTSFNTYYNPKTHNLNSLGYLGSAILCITEKGEYLERTWIVIHCTLLVCQVQVHLYGFESRCTALQFDLQP